MGQEMNPAVLEATRLWTLAVPTVSAFVTSLVRDFQDRDEILQETAVAVMESFDRYDSSQSFMGWAIGIARNQVRLYFRRKSRERLAFDSDAVEALAQAFVESHAKDQRLDYLTECVEGLEAKARELCRLRYERDLKPAAIGEQIGMGANAVAKALERIRERLRECIERKSIAAEVGG
jgi:RNA polymerase sigma-70 factor, ECF subfamily